MDIIDPIVTDYLRAHLPEQADLLKEMENFAKDHHVPIIELEVAQFLRVLLSIHQPTRILEVGSAIGYSALVMASTPTIHPQITGIELRDDYANLADVFIQKAKKEEQIQILRGDALEVLPTLNESYDFIFIDAAKGQYPKFFKEAERLLTEDGVIISDNVLFQGMICEEGIVNRRKITIIKRLRKYIDELMKNPDFITSIVTIEDGMAISKRIKK